MTEQQNQGNDQAGDEGLRLQLTPEQQEEVMGYIARMGGDPQTLKLVVKPLMTDNVLATSTFLIGTAE